MDHWIVRALVPLAAWILLSGLDDLFIDLVFCWQWLRVHMFLSAGRHWPSAADLDRQPPRRIAIFVPLWHEAAVVGNMLEHNLAAIHYDQYDFFLGIYPNDTATFEAVQAYKAVHDNASIALCPHDGPTSKADCLNWIYQRMLLAEQERGIRYDVIVTHDAEDLIHPESLRLINYFMRSYDMVQVPVLALPTPAREFVHGMYCDDFAEYQTKDIPVRQFLGGFIASNGVGTGYSRAILEKLAQANQNRIFEPECLTEDYENGYRIHRLGGRQLFLPIHSVDYSFAATREYFPRRFRAALKQRTRWTIGISLQSWERHGWRIPVRQLYWFWRDRKGLIGNLVSPLTNLLFLCGVLSYLPGMEPYRWWVPPAGRATFLQPMFVGTLCLSLLHLGIRTACSARIYGVVFALGVPLRAVLSNWINCLATVQALARYFWARFGHRPLVWVKTEHMYPNRSALMVHKRSLGEVLVASGAIEPSLLATAQQHKPPREQLGDFLCRMGILDEFELYRALSLQQNLPFGLGAVYPIAPQVTRALPAAVSRKWKILPFRIAMGELFLAGPELPSEEMTHDLRRFSRLSIRYHLVTPAEYDELAHTYLPR